MPAERQKGWKIDGEINAQEFETGLLLVQWMGDSTFSSTTVSATQRVKAVEKSITNACDFTLRLVISKTSGKPPAHWWNPDIASNRKICSKSKREKTRCCAKLHRHITRGAAQGTATDVAHEIEAVHITTIAYKEARKQLRISITKSKAACWNELIDSVEKDPWGKPYKLVTNKLRGPPVTSKMEPEDVSRITDVLFPLHPLMEVQAHVTEEPPLFSSKELKRAVERAQRKNIAPGLDHIIGKILNTLHQVSPSILLGLYNQGRSGTNQLEKSPRGLAKKG